MIGYLKGRVISKYDRQLLIDVGGVGYELTCTDGSLAHASANVAMELFVHTHVREDQFKLFGFQSMREKELFIKLTSVSGIGPKTGIEMLAVGEGTLLRAIATGDATLLTQVPGIGKKTAERVVMELQDKISIEDIGEVPMDHVAEHKEGRINSVLHERMLESNYADVIEALLGLGYDKKSIITTVSRYVEGEGNTDASEEDIVKYCLQHL